nr:substrate-binding domain-containing protein [Simiduia aestuariiviva]
MRTGITRCIGLIIPDLTNPFFPQLAQKIEFEARAVGLSVFVVDCQNQAVHEEEGLNLMEQQQVDGVIWCPTGNRSTQRLARLRCPVVLVDRPLPGFDAVHSDYRAGGQLLAQHAIELGHRTVGLLSGPQETESARLRRAGFVEAAAGRLDIQWEEEVPFSSELSPAARQALAASKASLVVAANDLIAVGALDELRSLGKRVPEDVSLMGFDDIPWSALITPSLTTIRQPIAALAHEALSLLTAKMLDRNRPVSTRVVGVSLVERNSAIALNHG